MPNKSSSSFYLLFLLGIVSVTFVWSFIDPHDRFTWILETLPVMIVIPILAITYRQFRLTNLLYALIALHCIILLIGGHYTYAKVPFFDYLKDIFHFSRNHFDRLGHIAQGFIPAIAIRELLLRTSPLKAGKWLTAIIIFSCLGISATYEILEWGVAQMTGEKADSFLGTQGDPWDTQVDMFFALVGTLISLLTLSHWHDKLLTKMGKS